MTIRTHSLCSIISRPIRPACCTSVFSVPEIVSIVRSCSWIIICCSSRAHCLWWSSSLSSRRGDLVPERLIFCAEGKGVWALVTATSALISCPCNININFHNIRMCRGWKSPRNISENCKKNVLISLAVHARHTVVVQSLLHHPIQTSVRQLIPQSYVSPCMCNEGLSKAMLESEG